MADPNSILAPNRPGFLQGVDSPEHLPFLKRHNDARILAVAIETSLRAVWSRRQRIRDLQAELDDLGVRKYVRHRKAKVEAVESDLRRLRGYLEEYRRHVADFSEMLAGYLRSTPGPVVHNGLIFELVGERVRVTRVEDRDTIAAIDARRASD